MKFSFSLPSCISKVLSTLGLIVVFFGSQSLFAGEHEELQYLSKSDISIGATIALRDNTFYPSCSAGMSNRIKRIFTPRLVYGRSNKSDVEGVSFSYLVDYSILESPDPNAITLALGTLEVVYDGVNYTIIDENDYSFHSDQSQAVLIVTDVQQTGSIPSDADLRLEFALFVDAKLCMESNLPANFRLNFHPEGGDQYTFSWGYHKGAESYEFEFAWVDEFAPPLSIEQIFDAATSVSTNDLRHLVQLPYPKGDLYFRVRAVGSFTDVSNVGKSLKRTNWSTYQLLHIDNSSDDLAVSSYDAAYSFQRSMSELGRETVSVSYVDDALRSRQTSITQNSDKSIVRLNHYYDAHGRPSISMLPFPMQNSSLGFSSLLDRVLSSSPSSLISGWSFKDFDRGGEYCNPVLNSILDQAGVAQYYSKENNSVQGGRSLIPDAFGKPFGKTVFRADGTNRPVSQVAVGGDSKTRYVYGTADEFSLRRLFGSSVGPASQYNRDIVVDPDGNASVSYSNNSGNVIATALLGGEGSTLTALSGQTTSITNVPIRLLELNRPDPIDSRITHAVYRGFHEVAGDVDIDYRLDAGFNLESISTNQNNQTEILPCSQCGWELIITVTDECGLPIPISNNFNGNTQSSCPVALLDDSKVGVVRVSRSAQIPCENSSSGVCPNSVNLLINFTPNVQQAYIVSKTLRMISPESEEIRNAVIENYVPTRDDAIDQAIIDAQSEIDTLCDFTPTTSGPLTEKVAQQVRCAFTNQGLITDFMAGGYLAPSQVLTDPNGWYQFLTNINSTVTLIDPLDQSIICVGADCISLVDSDSKIDYTIASALVSLHDVYDCELVWCRTTATVDNMTNSLSGSSVLPELANAGVITYGDLKASLSNGSFHSLVSNEIAAILPDFSTVISSLPAAIDIQPYQTLFSTTATPSAQTHFNDGLTSFTIAELESAVLSFYAGIPDAELIDVINVDAFYVSYVLDLISTSRDALEVEVFQVCGGRPTASANSMFDGQIDSQIDDFISNSQTADPNDLLGMGYADAQLNCEVIAAARTEHILIDVRNALIDEGCLDVDLGDLALSLRDYFAGQCAEDKFALVIDVNLDASGFPSSIVDNDLSGEFQNIISQCPQISVFGQDGVLSCYGDDHLNVYVSNSNGGQDVVDVNFLGVACLINVLEKAEELAIVNLLYDQSGNTTFKHDLLFTSATFSSSGLPQCFLDGLNSRGLVSPFIRVERSIGFVPPDNASSGSLVWPIRDELKISVYASQQYYSLSLPEFTYVVTASGTGMDFTVFQNPSFLLPANSSPVYHAIVRSSLLGSGNYPLYTCDYPIIAEESGCESGSCGIFPCAQNPNSFVPCSWSIRVNASPYTPTRCYLTPLNTIRQNYSGPLCTRTIQPSPDYSAACQSYYEDIISDRAGAEWDRTIDIIVSELTRDFECSPVEDMLLERPSEENHFTLYYYDRAGNLVQTVPPVGVHPLVESAFDSDTGEWLGDEPQHEFQTTYSYDGFGSVLASKSPDAGLTNMVYDRANRLRGSQDASQVKLNQLTYFRYDEEGRLIETGEWDDHTTAFPTDREDVDLDSWPIITNANDITRTFYNTVTNPSAGFSQENLRGRVSAVEQKNTGGPTDITTFYSYDAHGNVQSLRHSYSALPTKPFDLEYEYDLISGNVLGLSLNDGKGDELHYKYRYDADNRLKEALSSGDGRRFDLDARYEYYLHGPVARMEYGEDVVQGVDHALTLRGWMRSCNAAINAGTDSDPGEDGGYLAVVGGSGSVGSRPKHNLIPGDEASWSLGYYAGDYNPIAAGPYIPDTSVDPLSIGHVASTEVKSLYSGNVSWMTTQLPEVFRQAQAAGASVRSDHSFAYRYDRLNRIVAAQGGEYIAGGYSAVPETGVRYEYDANGNLQELFRGLTDPLSAGGATIAELNYQYKPNTNRLLSVGDGVGGNLNRGYMYEKNGAVSRRTGPAQSIYTELDWRHDGKIRSARVIDEAAGDALLSTSSYAYSATGDRIARDLPDDPNVADLPTYKDFYVLGAGGERIATYKWEVGGNSPEGQYPKLQQSEIDLLGSSRVGVWRPLDDLARRDTFGLPNGGPVAYQPCLLAVPCAQDAPISECFVPCPENPISVRTLRRGEKRYEMTNHLGNVLATVTDRKIGLDGDGNGIADSYRASVSGAQDYYPFGAKIASRTVSDNYRYGFNGKESDSEVGYGWQDYGFRLYEEEIGRFLSVDPRAGMYAGLTPYSFVNNSPLANIDMRGDSITPVGSYSGGYNYSGGSTLSVGGYSLRGGVNSGGNSVWIATAQESGGYRDDYVVDPESFSEFWSEASFYYTIAEAGNIPREKTPSIWRDWDKSYEQNLVEWGYALGGRPDGDLVQTAWDQWTFEKVVSNVAGAAHLTVVTARPSAPPVPYNRRAHYGSTPTRADRSHFGADSRFVVDHNPPLVKRYYEGDPSIGEPPGYLLTPVQRRASANDRSRMQLQLRGESNVQGGHMSTYSKNKKKQYFGGT